MKHVRAALVMSLLAACGSESDAAYTDAPNGSATDAGTSAPTDASAPHVTQSVVVAIDPDTAAGRVIDVFGVNKRPIAFNAKDPSIEYDIAAAYKAFGITSVRFNDDVVDPCEVYKDGKLENYDSGSPVATTSCDATNKNGPPHLKWTVRDASKVNDPANYRFDALDKAMSVVVASGAKLYLRLGHRYNGVNDTGDPASWAKVSVNIYRHIVGTFGSNSVKVSPASVEVFNEPDGLYWAGTKEDFSTLYNGTTDGVRAAATAAGEKLSVGGPGFTANYLKTSTNPKNVADGFVKAVTPARLDFFSTHWYDQCDQATLFSAESYFKGVRASIDQQGLTSKPLHISEWNIGLNKDCAEDAYETAEAGSYASGVLTLMQDPQYNMGIAHFFSGVSPMSLFAVETTLPGQVFVRPTAWAFWAHHKLIEGTRMKLSVCKDASCTSGTVAASPVLAIAASAEDKRYAVVTNDTAESMTITLRVAKRTGGAFSAYALPSSVQSFSATKKTDMAYTANDTSIASLIANVPNTSVAGVSTSNGLEGNLTMRARSVVLVQLP